MRIFIVDTYYADFLAIHYANNPQLESAGYAQQRQALMDTFFGTADSYSYYLRRLGHEAEEVVANCEPLQRAWVREHSLGLASRAGEAAADDIVLAQAQMFSPDVVYIQDLNHLGPRTLSRLRHTSGFLAGQIASRLPSRSVLRAFDLLVTSFPHFADRFRRLGLRADYLKLAFDPRVLKRLEYERPEGPEHDAVFIGALAGRHWRAGKAILSHAAARTPLRLWGYGLPRWLPRSALRASYQGEAWGIEMYRILRASKVALNRHGEIAGDFANNMRLYEATGVGAMLLTDAKKNLGELFEVDREVVTYADARELVEKIHYYLNNEDARAAIARAGQARTLREHTYEQRMQELVRILEAA